MHTATVYDDPTYNPCGTGAPRGHGDVEQLVVHDGDRNRPETGRWLVVGSLAMLGATLVRRRRQR